MVAIDEDGIRQRDGGLLTRTEARRVDVLVE
jgi:hypothetical protein